MMVHWHEGQFLQPHLLQLQQRHLLSEIRASRALGLTDAWGVLEGSLSHDDLGDGRVRFERLKVIMPSGQEVAVPQGARLLPLNLKQEMARGAGPWDIYLIVPLWNPSGANAFELGSAGRADSRVKLLYLPEEANEVPDENTGARPVPVVYRKVNARLAVATDDDVTSNDSPVERIRLLRVTLASGDETGRLRADPEVAPPCVVLRASPALHDRMRELCAVLNAAREQLRLKLAGGGMGLEAKWEFQTKLGVLNRYCGFLPTLVEDGRVAPRALYLHLRSLLGELLVFSPAEEFDCAPYEHADPFPSFAEVGQKIRRQLRPAQDEYLKVDFQSVSPGLLRADLQPMHFERPTAYFLGVKIKADRTKLALLVTNANSFKLMPWSMKDLALFGLELTEENQPPLELPRDGSLYFFRISGRTANVQSQRRWEQILKDKAAALRWNPSEFDMGDATVTLFMTVAGSV